MRPTQVEIAILQSRRFVGKVFGSRDLQLEWRHFRVVQDQYFVGVDLDVAGRELGVVRALALDNLAFYRYDKLTAKILRLGMCIARILFIQNNLRHPVAVAEVDKRQHPKIALLCNPTHQYNLLADMAFAQFATGVSAFQISEYIQHKKEFARETRETY